jgi:glyoxylase-like metal-dependent hydrolase (beta-lactamase superfamily II)
MRFSFGDMTVFPLEEGVFRLDGGQIFGIVPRVLWEKSHAPDPMNRIVMGIHPLLVKTPDRLILLETGIGENFQEKFRDMYQIIKKPGLRASIRRAGFSPDEIDTVINTHLHFDHAGGNTIQEEGGRYRSAFPRADYYISEIELAAAKQVNERTKGSYRERHFLPLEREGRIRPVRGEIEIAPGVVIFPNPGHTAGHQGIRLSSGGTTFVFPGDGIPMEIHLAPAYIAGMDLFPLETLKSKKQLLEEASDKGWILCFYHDPRIKFGTIEKTEGKYKLRKLDLT